MLINEEVFCKIPVEANPTASLPSFTQDRLETQPPLLPKDTSTNYR
jgi:hypothetical protein